MLAEVLKKRGHEVVETTNGLEAWETMQQPDTPRMAILDWMMPGMDGLELCRAIREDDSRGYVFIILLTVRSSREDIVKGLEAGADDFLIKPPDPSELSARIKNGIRILKLEKNLKKANEALRISSLTDPLTGIYNRGYLTEHLPRDIKRARRYRHPLSLILCDIDYFKKVNDTFGHLIGDQVLVEFVRRIAGSIRKNVDWIVRYGGEEFMIVLPETNCEGACVVAERLRHLVGQTNIKVQGKEIRISASFGISAFDADTSDEKISFETMISLADKWLYQAKRKGRNRVEVEKL
jgi:two-component system, cell cycle response regulator